MIGLVGTLCEKLWLGTVYILWAVGLWGQFSKTSTKPKKTTKKGQKQHMQHIDEQKEGEKQKNNWQQKKRWWGGGMGNIVLLFVFLSFFLCAPHSALLA